MYGLYFQGLIIIINSSTTAQFEPGLQQNSVSQAYLGLSLATSHHPLILNFLRSSKTPSIAVLVVLHSFSLQIHFP